jgi:ACT domain-containing protein
MGGRPPIDLDEAKVRAARRLQEDHTLNIDDICKTLNISRSTYYRYIKLKQRNSLVQNQSLVASPWRQI